jgi:hypothetical protein
MTKISSFDVLNYFIGELFAFYVFIKQSENRVRYI